MVASPRQEMTLQQKVILNSAFVALVKANQQAAAWALCSPRASLTECVTVLLGFTRIRGVVEALYDLEDT